MIFQSKEGPKWSAFLVDWGRKMVLVEGTKAQGEDYIYVGGIKTR